MTDTPTPTPWTIDDGALTPQDIVEIIKFEEGTGAPWVAIGIEDEDGFAECVAYAHPNNAALIVKAVNNHATIRNLVEERDDLEDRLSLVRVELDNAQKTLARRTVEWTDWKDRAEKAEAYIGGHLDDEVETTIRKLVEERDELLSEVEDMRDMKWQRDAAEDRAEKAESDLAAARLEIDLILSQGREYAAQSETAIAKLKTDLAAARAALDDAPEDEGDSISKWRRRYAATIEAARRNAHDPE